MHEKIFCDIRKYLDVSAEKFNSHLFKDTQGFSALGLDLKAHVMWLSVLCRPQVLPRKPQHFVSTLLPSVSSVYMCGRGLLSVADLSQLWPLHSP